MKTQIISGSHRLNSQSLKVAKYLENLVKSKGSDAKITDLSRGALPLWDERVWENDAEWMKIWSPIAADLRVADSLIVVVPEYSGMAAPALKNFFLFCGADLVGHKPAMLVSVSAGMGGSYPIAELRSSSYKNTHLTYTPDHVIVRDAQHVLNAEINLATPSDGLLRTRLDYSVRMLEQYAQALKLVRESGVPNYKEFANGM